MIGAGTVPFAIVSADEIVRARAMGNLVIALFTVYQTNPQGIMTPPRADLKPWQTSSVTLAYWPWSAASPIPISSRRNTASAS